MHYRHSFHAGNFADVMKHVLLCGLIQAMNRKDKPWMYLDTHSGAAVYDLRTADAQRTQEWEDGIARLQGISAPGPMLQTYLAQVRELRGGANSLSEAGLYPGSPWLAAAMARTGDRVVACERVPEIAEALSENLRGVGAATCAVHQRDGYEASSLLPPAEKRGLILIDPPFERPDEFDACASFVIKATQRFSNGVYAIWYPIKNRFEAERFLRRMGRELARPALNVRLDTDAPGAGQMRASGVLIVNPPFRFEQEAEPVMRLLSARLAQGPNPSFTIEWTRPETP